MRNMTEKIPPLMIERPKMNKATWDALKAHIVKEKAKKKQAMEQTQEFERLRREREQKKKEQALTLEETKSEIARLEKQLILHKEGKHMLFQKLKKVIHQEQGMKDNEKSNLATQMYLQPPSRLTSTSIYQRSSAPSGIVSLVDHVRAPAKSGSLKRPSDESPFGPPVMEDPYKRQRPLPSTVVSENGKKGSAGPFHENLSRSNFQTRELNREELKLTHPRDDPVRQAARNATAASLPPNPITPSASPSTGSSDVATSHLVLPPGGSRMTPAASPLTAPMTPSTTETTPSEVHDADGNIQSETSSKSTDPSPASGEATPYRLSADAEKNLQSMASIQSAMRNGPSQPWLGMDVQGVLPHPIVSDVIRPTPSFAPTAYPVPTRYGDGVAYGSAFMRPFDDGLRFSQQEKMHPQQGMMGAAPNLGAAYPRLGDPGNADRHRQSSTSFLPPNSSSSSGHSKLSTEPVTTSAPYFLPSHLDPRIYSHQREQQVLAHFHQQAYAAAAMAHLPQHYRYDASLMQGYPSYLGMPLMGGHPIQPVEQALGRRAESYYEK